MPTVVDLVYTGALQDVVVPAGVTDALLEVWGASGNGAGGEGGYMAADIADLVPGETLAVFVGQSGQGFVGGWNGGGNGALGTANYSAGAGGGATDIRRGGVTLADRILIGGGGGGGAYRSGDPGGTGGHPAGGGTLIAGGTQTGPGDGTYGPEIFGTLGVGADNAGGGSRKIGGGGGGLWGGNSGDGASATNAGAGGGSSYYDVGLSLVTAEAVGTWVGDGKARITFPDPTSFFDTELSVDVTVSGEVVIPRRSAPRRELLWISDLAGDQVGVIG